MKERRNTAAAVLVTAVLTAALTYGMTRSHGSLPARAPEAHAEEKAQGHKPEITGLKFEVAVSGESWDVVTATGKVGPNTNKVVKVGPRIAGRIASVQANVGDVVSRGQVLAVVSSVELAQARAAYRLASARVAAAREAYDQKSRLAKLGAFSSRPAEEAGMQQAAARGELLQARGELAQARSELAEAESELAQCASRLARAKELYKDEIVSRQDLEAAEAEYKRDSAEVDSAKSRIRQAEAKVQQAQAEAAIAKGYLDRERKILGSNLLSSRELQQAKAELTSARLELEAAANTIRVLGADPGASGETIAVVSPISGRVVERNVNLGEMAEPSTVLFTVMNLSDVWVEANVYEKDITKVRKGQPVEVRTSAYPGKVFPGRAAYVGDVLDSASRTARIRCEVSNPGGILKPEMFATVDIIAARRPGAVLVPRAAVLDDAGKKIVFTVCRECEEPDYEKKVVTLGSERGRLVEITSGVQAGEEIVVQGQYQLKTALGSSKLEAGCGQCE